MESLGEKEREKIKMISKYLIKSSNTIVLTGAGISTNSGIPDFRGKGGIWEKYKQESYANIEIFQKNPLKFWKIAEKIAPKLFTAKPNPGHYILAELEKMNMLKGIITQNIDQLHQKAGSIVVYEVHGNINHYVCLNCKTNYSKKRISKIYKKSVTFPLKCKICSSPLKPSVVLFGESLLSFEYYKSKQLAQEADILLVAGSSLMVNPIANLPLYTIERGGKLIIINEESTYLDDKADVVIQNKTEIILPLILQQIKKDILKKTKIEL